MIAREYNPPLHRLLSEVGCHLPPEAVHLMAADQARGMLNDSSWLAEDATNVFGRLCQLFDPEVRWSVTECADQPMPLVGIRHNKGVYWGARPKVPYHAWKIWWNDPELISHAWLLRDIVEVGLAWSRAATMGQSRFQMAWADHPGWVLTTPASMAIASMPAPASEERRGVDQREHLTLVSLDPIFTESPLTIGSRCLRLLKGSRGTFFTNPGVADISWSVERVEEDHDRSCWTFRALRPTRELAVAIRTIPLDTPPCPQTEIEVRCDEEELELARHPEWPEIRNWTSESEWPTGSRVRLSLNVPRDRAELCPNPLVLEPESDGEVPGDCPSTEEKWNVVAAPVSLKEFPWLTHAIADRWFVSCDASEVVRTGQLLESLRRRFVLSRFLDVHPVAKIATHSKQCELRRGIAVEMEYLDGHHRQRTSEAVRRVAEELSYSNRVEKGFVHVQTKP